MFVNPFFEAPLLVHQSLGANVVRQYLTLSSEDKLANYTLLRQAVALIIRQPAFILATRLYLAGIAGGSTAFWSALVRHGYADHFLYSN